MMSPHDGVNDDETSEYQVITAIHKEILVFTFSCNLNLSSKDIKVENM